MFQVTILDLVFATMILGLVFVPQVTLPENSNNSTNSVDVEAGINGEVGKYL